MTSSSKSRKSKSSKASKAAKEAPAFPVRVNEISLIKCWVCRHTFK